MNYLYTPVDAEIGARIKQAREKKRITQRELHDKTGIAITQISNYENGNAGVGLQTLAKIAKALNTTIDELYFGPNSKRPVNGASNKGELIVNCIVALYEEGVVRRLVHLRQHGNQNTYVYDGFGYMYLIGFERYVEILDDLLSKLDDFKSHKDSLPNPDGFREQLLVLAANRINKEINNK